jgi:FtsZ-binding cell division protein ZapB
MANGIADVIRNLKTKEEILQLLETSQEQRELLMAQEEELRQNMEELATTQEQLLRKEQMYQERIRELESKMP